MQDEDNPQEFPTTLNTLSLILSAISIILIMVALFYARPSQAAESWASQWVDGYTVGFCWTRNPCDYIPPVQIPYPEDGQSDGYIAGLKAGLEDGKEDI